MLSYNHKKNSAHEDWCMKIRISWDHSSLARSTRYTVCYTFHETSDKPHLTFIGDLRFYHCIVMLPCFSPSYDPYPSLWNNVARLPTSAAPLRATLAAWTRSNSQSDQHSFLGRTEEMVLGGSTMSQSLLQAWFSSWDKWAQKTTRWNCYGKKSHDSLGWTSKYRISA